MDADDDEKQYCDDHPFPGRRQDDPRRRRDRGAIREIQQIEIAKEEDRRLQAKGVMMFEKCLVEEMGLHTERRRGKLKRLLTLHSEKFQTCEDAEEDYNTNFFNYLVGDDDEDDEGTTRRLSTLNKMTQEDFEEMERQRNEDRHPSRRFRESIIKINAWHQHYTLTRALELARESIGRSWLSSLHRCDPRRQIMTFFDEVAREGGDVPMDERIALSPLWNVYHKASVFTVWRPTSDEAIKNMMLGIACGKAFDIKGKSANRGNCNISSYVPFIQIYEEGHKEECRSYLRNSKTIRIFYSSQEQRAEAHGYMLDILENTTTQGLAHDDISMEYIDTCIDAIKQVYGLEVTEHLFWESYINSRDCSRPPDTEWDTGRCSIPAFMEMNLDTIRHDHEPGEPRPVVYQMSKTDPMEPRMLLMAYEENGGVKPVVSDFDCFILGSRGVRYEKPIPPEQVELVQWSVENISQILDERASGKSKMCWTETWIEARNRAIAEGYYPETPKFGNGDPKSYEIIEVAVSRLQDTGCVRHGAECFNWWFPQEIDDEFLIISNTLDGNVKWKKVNVQQLQDCLMSKIDEGFTFPLNPKWILCDPGWRRVYDKLQESQRPNVQDSMNCWFPPDTGLREKIDEISARHPRGFDDGGRKSCPIDIAMMMNDLEKHVRRGMENKRAMAKLKATLCMTRGSTAH